jgi:hypothetical protein
MNKVTLEQFKSFGPCWLIEHGGDKKSEARLYLLAKQFPDGATALDILGLDISANEKMWSVLRTEFIPAPVLHEAGCRFGEWALNFAKEKYGLEPDPRSIEGIAFKRRWIRGEATDKELAAARDAAWDAAAGAAAWDAAAGAAAWGAARAVAAAAARYAWGAARAAWGAAWGVATLYTWDAAWNETELVAILRELLEKWEREEL